MLSTVYGCGGQVDGGTSTRNFTPNPTCTFAELESYSQTIWVLLDTTTTASPRRRRHARHLHRPHAAAAARPALLTAAGGEQAVIAHLAGRRLRPSSPTCSATRCCATAAASCRCSPTATFEPGFQTCPATISRRPAFRGLDPFFVCSPLLAPTTRSFRVKILQNDIIYGVAVVAIDKQRQRQRTPGHPLREAAIQDQELLRRLPRRRDPDQVRAAATGGFCTLARRTSEHAAPGWALGVAAARSPLS